MLKQIRFNMARLTLGEIKEKIIEVRELMREKFSEVHSSVTYAQYLRRKLTLENVLKDLIETQDYYRKAKDSHHKEEEAEAIKQAKYKRARKR